MAYSHFFVLLLLLGVAVADPVVPSLPISDNYPYGIKLDYDPGSPAERNETVTIYQNGKKYYLINDYDIQMIYRGDLDGDGYDEAILRTFSGGAHCCFQLVFLKFTSDMPNPKIYDWGNTEYVTLKDLDGDKQPEIITWDDRYSYGFGLSFAESAKVKIVARFQNGALRLDPNLMKKFFALKLKKLSPVKIGIDKRGFLSYSGSVRNIMNYVLYKIYIGETDDAIKSMHRYLLFDHPAVKVLFLEELVDSLSESPFWDDIRRLNRWEYETACIGCTGDGCIPPEELWDRDEVLHWMFVKHRSISKSVNCTF